jgi:TolB-like protein
LGGRLLKTLGNQTVLWRFGVFELDPRNVELRRSGVRIPLREQSFRILVHLVQHSGELVRRDDLRRLLWPDDTFVDFNHGLNTAMMRLRDALGDTANAPIYIETIPRRGYRFVAPVVPVEKETTSTQPVTPAPSAPLRDPILDSPLSIAVLPFKVSAVAPEVVAFADGLSAELLAGLLRFSYLDVVPRALTQRFATEDVNIRSLRNHLGARYVLEGTLRQAGSKLRVSIRLVDAISTLDLWLETFEQPFQPDSLFDLQDYLVPLVVSTIAGGCGVLPRSIGQGLRGKPLPQITPGEAVIRALGYFQDFSAEDHAASQAVLERTIELAPARADCWAMLSLIYAEEFAHGINPHSDSLTRALAAAERAIETDPSNHLAYHALASVLFFQKDIHGFRAAADRAISLNPLDAFTIARLGFLIACSGEWSLGCALAARAHDLNHHRPGWYLFPHLLDAYRKRDYARAIDIGTRIDLPRMWPIDMALAAAYGQIGELENAARFLRALQAARPGFVSNAREELSKWSGPDLIEHLISGLSKAGLETAASA